MLTATRKALCKGIAKFMDKENLDTSKIKDKDKNPFPVSAKWIDNLRKAERYNENVAFDLKRSIEMFEFLEMPYRLDGGVIISTNKKSEDETH